MKIEMNIGLAVDGHAGSDTAVLERATRAVRLLSESLYFGRVADRIERVSYTDPKLGPVVEPTLVVRAEMRAPLRDVRDMVYYIAERLQQDCIAVLYVGDGGETGEMIGPRCAGWAFNPEFFVRFDRVATAPERAAA